MIFKIMTAELNDRLSAGIKWDARYINHANSEVMRQMFKDLGLAESQVITDALISQFEINQVSNKNINLVIK